MLNFVKEQKNNNSQELFTHLKLGSEGYIKNVSRFSNVKWLYAIGVKTSEEVSHLRHTFANVLKQAGVSEQLASVLLRGHASQSISYSGLVKDQKIETFLNEIKKR